MAAGGAGIARPGFDQPGIEIFGERAQDAETVRFGRVERQDEQHGVIDPLDGLVEHERGIARHAIGNAVPGELERVRGEREPVVAMARSEEHTSELQSLMRISYAVFCLKQKTNATLTPRYDTLTTKKEKQPPEPPTPTHTTNE